MSRQPSAELERHIGQRLRAARKEKGWSMEVLGDAIGVSYQQISRFEKGEHRISAGQLYTLSCCLGRPVSWFFQAYKNQEDKWPKKDSKIGEREKTYSETDAELLQRLEKVVNTMSPEQRKGLADFLELL